MRKLHGQREKTTWIRPSLLATGPNPLPCTASKDGPTELLLLNLSTALLLKDSWTLQNQGTATCLWCCEPNPPKIPPESEPAGDAETRWLGCAQPAVTPLPPKTGSLHTQTGAELQELLTEQQHMLCIHREKLCP